IGQEDFASSGSATTQSGLKVPADLAVNQTNGMILVIDSQNNRVLGYDNIASVAPTLVSPAASATEVSCLPTFLISNSDADGDALQYKIELATNSGFTNNLVEFN